MSSSLYLQNFFQVKDMIFLSENIDRTFLDDKKLSEDLKRCHQTPKDAPINSFKNKVVKKML